jgi:hypothetical protein
VEAVHTSGPFSPVRHSKILEQLADFKPGIVFVTAFEDRTKFRAHAADIAWETEVWISKDPDHLIHFNGDKFMGPHERS